MPEWVYVIRPACEGFKTEQTEEEQSIMAEHFGYLKRLFDDGKLTLAGPALDTTFGIVVFEAEGEDAATEIMNSDPAVIHGVMNATVHPFRSSLMRGRDT